MPVSEAGYFQHSKATLEYAYQLVREYDEFKRKDKTGGDHFERHAESAENQALNTRRPPGQWRGKDRTICD